MVKRILVPLDNAVNAESMIEAVGTLARSSGATVRLMHVAPRPELIIDDDGNVLAYADQETARLEAAGLDDLRRASLGLEGVPVEHAVRFGDPVAEIVQDAEDWNADVVAMATRGRSGIGRALLGSVAEQVFRRAPMAVILYRAERDRA